MKLTDKQWKVIQPLFPQSKSKPGSRGRSTIDKWSVFNGILQTLRTGARWCEFLLIILLIKPVIATSVLAKAGYAKEIT